MMVSISGPTGNFATNQHGVGPTSKAGAGWIEPLSDGAEHAQEQHGAEPFGRSWEDRVRLGTERRPEMLLISTEPDPQRLGRSRAD